MSEVTCVLCGCDVSGCSVTISPTGQKVYRQVTSRADGIIYGGLSHIEGGVRCLSDVEPAVIAAIQFYRTRGLSWAATIRLALQQRSHDQRQG